MDKSYTESVIWAFKQLYDKGLAYQGHRVLPYCWNDRTPLSNHELKMDDEIYRDRTDNTVTVGLRLEQKLREDSRRPELALIWTTTPWTLPSNSAVAVGPQIEYSLVEVAADHVGNLAGERVLIATDLIPAYAKELGEDPTVVATYKGHELVGLHYHPIYDYFDTPERRAEGGIPGPNAWSIIAADYVTTTDGTGLVHQAPAFGEDDMWTCMEYNIGLVMPVDEGGVFTSEAASRSCTRPCPRGSCASPRSATAWSS